MLKADTIALMAALLPYEYVAGQKKNVQDNAKARVECALELVEELKRQAPHLVLPIYVEEGADPKAGAKGGK